VHGEVGLEPDEQMLAARDDFTNLPTPEIRRGKSRHAEVARGEHCAGERGVQALRGPPDGVTLGHWPTLGHRPGHTDHCV
jgi:hypothetical protein